MKSSPSCSHIIPACEIYSQIIPNSSSRLRGETLHCKVRTSYLQHAGSGWTADRCRVSIMRRLMKNSLRLASAKTEQEFFPAGHVKSNFLCNIGYGDASKLWPRSPRLDFSEACTLM